MVQVLCVYYLEIVENYWCKDGIIIPIILSSVSTKKFQQQFNWSDRKIEFVSDLLINNYKTLKTYRECNIISIFNMNHINLVEKVGSLNAKWKKGQVGGGVKMMNNVLILFSVVNKKMVFVK